MTSTQTRPRTDAAPPRPVRPAGKTPLYKRDRPLWMLLPGGVERTEEEFRRLYESAGFRLTRTIPTAGDLFVVEGVPA